MTYNKAIIYLAWGKDYIRELHQSLAKSITLPYDKFLITEKQYQDVQLPNVKVIGVNFETKEFLRKAELYNYLPQNYDSYVFLDTDIQVLGDISFGFEKAEMNGIAVSPESHYCLDRYFNFGKIMKREKLSCSGQLQYNTGVIFFSRSKKVKDVFDLWFKFAKRYFKDFNNDQPYFTMAMEACSFNPYTLSINYNYRGTGEQISGDVRIWHSHYKIPKNINEDVNLWPMRSVLYDKLTSPKRSKWLEINHNIREFYRRYKKTLD
jgi:lipopolysaccharide biosynthesis glycosyltransferase